MKKDISTTILVTFGILLGNFFSYLLQFFLGRNLTVSDYGAFNTLLSVAAIVGVPSTVFGTALIKHVAALSAKKESIKVKALFWQSMLWSIVAGVLLFGFFYIFRDTVFVSLKITNTSLVTAFAFYVSLTFLWSVPYAYFQGLLQYKLFTIFMITSGFLRCVLPIFILFTNKQLASVFWGMALACFLVIVISTVLLKMDFTKTKDLAVWKELWSIIKFSFPVLITNVCLLAFNNNDLILVRRYFSAEDSGFYAGTVTLGKILLFGAATVATVMYPKIAALKSKQGDVRSAFNLYAKMQLIVVVAGVAAFSLFPKLIATLFFGTKFLESTQYLPLFSVFIGLYVLLNFLILFLFAVDITSLSYALLFLLMSQTLLISRFHSSMYQVIGINISVISIALIVAYFYSARFIKSHRVAV